LGLIGLSADGGRAICNVAVSNACNASLEAGAPAAAARKLLTSDNARSVCALLGEARLLRRLA
jgi:hypothetical protein